jgi:hypothetical protein
MIHDVSQISAWTYFHLPLESAASSSSCCGGICSTRICEVFAGYKQWTTILYIQFCSTKYIGYWGCCCSSPNHEFHLSKYAWQ